MSIWLVPVLTIAVMAGYALGYWRGWRACYRQHSRRVVAVDSNSTSITIAPARDLPAVGDVLWLG